VFCIFIRSAEEGERRYCANELINGYPELQQLDLTKCDIFSLAISVYELCLGRPLLTSAAAPEEEVSREWSGIRDGTLAAVFEAQYSPELNACLRQVSSCHSHDLKGMIS